MKVEELYQILQSDFFTGVPDSQLKALCNYLLSNTGISKHHIIGANEGNCVGLAAGYHLATGKIPVVYLQNSGIGNIVNPVLSLLSDMVYGIPCIFIIGWRGEPGVSDEPQHNHQGKVTIELLEKIGITPYIIDKNTKPEDLEGNKSQYDQILSDGKSIAFIIRKNSLEFNQPQKNKNINSIIREQAIERIIKVSGEDLIVSTTGKISRELFELREKNQQSHKYDFLTVGSMGHSSSIALGIALHKPSARVWCLDGDGSALMHMGAMGLIGSSKLDNLIHVVLNNNAHESVGGMPTAAPEIDFAKIASVCGYSYTIQINDTNGLNLELEKIRLRRQLAFMEIKCSLSSRDNLGRPTSSPKDNKNNFMDYLRTL